MKLTEYLLSDFVAKVCRNISINNGLSSIMPNMIYSVTYFGNMRVLKENCSFIENQPVYLIESMYDKFII